MLEGDVREAERLLAADEAYRPVILHKHGTRALRPILSPAPPLKRVQRWAAARLQRTLGHRVHGSAHGFVPARSIVTAARHHARGAPRSLLVVDLKDFFSTVTLREIEVALQGTGLALMAHLFTWEGILPQGAPTSPILANLVAADLDAQLAGLGHCYTRYADDLAFTASARLPGRTLLDVADVVEGAGFAVNKNKVRVAHTIQGEDYRQHLEIYGLGVGRDRVWIPGARLKVFRQAIIRGAYSQDKKERDRARGYLAFVKMVYGQLPPPFARVAPMLRRRHDD